MKLFARFLSYIFHPVFFFLIMPFLVVYRQTSSELYAIKWTVFSSVFIFFGLLLILFEVIKGDFSDFDVSKKEQRQKFFMILLILGLVYLSSAFIFKGVFFSLSFISLGITLGIIIFAIISRFTKASIHVAVSCAFVLSMSLFYGKGVFSAIVWLVPLIMWARLYLKKHTVSEVFAGGILGILITLLTFFAGKGLLF